MTELAVMLRVDRWIPPRAVPLVLALAVAAGCGERDAPAPAPLATAALSLDGACASWSCEPFSFHGDDGCDCACGCWDPDCFDPQQTLFGCEADEECVEPGVCEPIVHEPEEPCEGWSCDVQAYDTQGACDCACGCWDPDCDNPVAEIVGCDDEEACVPPGECLADATCDGWTCEPARYDNLDGCDCACGCWDPDCDEPLLETLNCASGEICVRPGRCAGAEICPGWTCDERYYGVGDECDCDCGCWDPDCDDPLLSVTGCEPDAVCVPPGTCRVVFEEPPCDEWICADAAYGGLDGCDCRCGCWDPDCDLVDPVVTGCEADETCFRPGVCRLTSAVDIPCAEWSCSDRFYDAEDGCDCRCGCWDPDCDHEGAVVWNCAEGDACIQPGVCASDCTPACGDRVCGGDGCGGSCGTCSAGTSCDAAGRCVTVCTPRCDERECGYDGCGGNCGGCPTGQVCEAYACVPCTPSCAGRTCGDDGCGGTCGSCEAGFVCQDGQCAAQQYRSEQDRDDGGTCTADLAGAPRGGGATAPLALLLLLLVAAAVRRRARP